MKRSVAACLGLAAMLMTSCAGVDLDDSPNVGPCPVAGTLYDASRVVEIDGPERHENVEYTGEIEIDFAFGKGPKATASTRTYPVFVTVTRRDRSVLAKERFDIQVAWPAGKDIVRHTETVPGIVIPRANETISGSNFEVLVGFDLTPEQLAYNRSGTRFTINVAKPAAGQ